MMSRISIVSLVFLVLLYVGYELYLKGGAGDYSEVDVSNEDVSLLRLKESQQSGVMISSEGVVERILSDDLEGSRHQRFIVRVGRDLTVLISHNIDLADRVPIEVGDSVSFRGQYEWNPQGGVIHWTHHDPAGRHAEGWIDHKSARFE